MLCLTNLQCPLHSIHRTLHRQSRLTSKQPRSPVRLHDLPTKLSSSISYSVPYSGQSVRSTSVNSMKSSSTNEKKLSQIAVITTVGCPYCKKVKQALRQLELPFAEIELSRDLDTLRSVKEVTKQATVPQVFIGGKFVGGSTQLLSLIDKEELDALLEETAGRDALPASLQALKTKTAGGPCKPCPVEDEALQKLQELAGRLRSRHLEDDFPGTFTADQLINWLVEEGAETMDAAREQAKGMLQAQILSILNGSKDIGRAGDHTVLGFVADARKPTLGEPLNGHFEWYSDARASQEVAEDLRVRILALYDRHLDEGGRAVDYKGLSQDPDFMAFVNCTAELQKVDMSDLSRTEKMAFWINIYNILVVHAMAVFGPASGTLARLKWFASIRYVVNGLEYSSNDIEHGILRGNKPSPAHPLSLIGLSQLAPPTFKNGDPRVQQAIHPLDPRIHFSLVCGAKSCPPIKVYSAEALEEGLASAASSFVESEVEIEVDQHKLVLSKIFQWYAKDFGSKYDLLALIMEYLPSGDKQKLETLLSRITVETLRFEYRPYDWSQNSK